MSRFYVPVDRRLHPRRSGEGVRRITRKEALLRQAGVVEARRTRETGRYVALIDALESPDYVPAEGGRWVTFCDRHGTFCQHETRALGRAFLAAPSEWCEPCGQDRLEGRTP